MPEILSIDGADIFIRDIPGEDGQKIINQKATQALGETHYLQVDYSVTVRILQTEGEWSRIEVVEPIHLAQTHKGWIPTKSIKLESSEQAVLEDLAADDFEILSTKHNSTVENYSVLILTKDFDEESVNEFCIRFKQQHCKMNCNVMVYDSKSIFHLIDKYPLERDEYIMLADHYVAMLIFDSHSRASWYPYQDFQYKEYGGKNWKKEPIN